MLKSCRWVGWWDLIDSFWIWGLAFGLGLRLGLVNTVKFNSTTNCFADGVWNMMVDGGNTARIIGVGLIWYNVRIVGASLMLNKTQPMRWIPRRDGGGHQPIRAPKHHCQPMVGCADTGEYYYWARYSAENPSEVRRIASVIRFVSSVEDILRIIENIILLYHLEAAQETTSE